MNNYQKVTSIMDAIDMLATACQAEADRRKVQQGEHDSFLRGVAESLDSLRWNNDGLIVRMKKPEGGAE
jgi:hypothetical protein